MGHLALLLMHGLAALFFWPALFLTIPIHLLYGVLAGNQSAREREREAAEIAEAQLRACPACAEKIQRAATVCRFCGTTVAPLPGPMSSGAAYNTGAALARALRGDRDNTPHL
jgi:ribosomal protein L37AE/L43A